MPTPHAELKQKEVEDVTREAESGHGEPIAHFLECLSFEDRIRTIKKIEELNQQDRNSNKAIPRLEISYGQETSWTDGIPFFCPEHNQYIAIRNGGTDTRSGSIYYESFDPRSLERTIRWKDGASWSWNKISLK